MIYSKVLEDGSKSIGAPIGIGRPSNSERNNTI